MLIQKRSQITGELNVMDIPVTQEQIDRWMNTPTLMVQDAFPHLTCDQREFLMTGATAKEWDALFDHDEE